MKIEVPPLGKGIDKVAVSCWYVQTGSEIKEGEDIVELSADKAIFSLPSPTTGILKEIFIKENSEAKIGEALGVIE
ncbi:MAG: lipoyl domain-containing protein [Candidatus Aceula meridiana]|nr:lipoyl domain-containing protein [Candidatus Aceula meridiana]